MRYRRSGGTAMLLVLIAVAMCTILALSFLAAQQPTATVASNIDRKVRARAIAESALQMAVDYVNEDADWRSDKPSGTWLTDAAMDGGTFTLIGVDEADGDLIDDPTDVVLLTVVARYEGVTHRVSARVLPGSGPPAFNRLLLIADSSSSPSSQDLAKRALFESWGYTVTLFEDSSSDAEYTAALEQHDVVYVSEESNSASIGSRLWGTPRGVVNEEGQLHDELRMAVSGADDYDSARTITILDNNHQVTTGLPLGEVAIYSADRDVVNTSHALGGGVAVLADGPGGDSDAAVFVVDAGDGLTINLSPGRRVILPFGDDFEVERLTVEGQRLVRQAIRWAEGATSTGRVPTLLALYEFNEQDVPDPNLIGHWKLDESAAPGSAGGVVAGDEINAHNSSGFDGYDPSAGAYSSSNRHLSTTVVTNARGSRDFTLNGGTLYGDLQIGSGGNPSSVVSLNNGARITGSTSVQSSNAVITDYDAPSGFGRSSGTRTYNSGSRTWSSNQHFRNLIFNNGARVNVSGDVQVRVSGHLTLNNGHIFLDPGASLTLWVEDHINLHNSSTINNDSTRPGDLTIIQYGDNKDMTISGGKIAGAIHVTDDLVLNNNAEIYGSVAVEDDITLNGGHIHASVSGGGVGAGGGITSAADAAGAGNDATVHGNMTGGADGVDGTAYAFDGRDDYVEIPHHSAYLLDAGTVSLHFYPDGLGGRQALFSKDSSGHDNGGHLHLYAEGNRLKARIQTTSDDPYGTGASVELESSGSALSDGRWHHATLTWGDGQFRLYLNGSLVDSANHLGGLGTTSGGSGNDEPIVIGAGSDTSGNQSATPITDPFTGRIDEVRIYDQPVDAGQAANLSAGRAPGPRTAPGYVVADTSGHETAADMFISDTSAIAWGDGGGLTFVGGTLATTLGAATKIHDAVEANAEFAVEITFLRMAAGATGAPSHLLGYGNAPSVHNFLIGQAGSNYQARIRDSDTGTSGSLSPEFVSSSSLPSGRAVQLLVTYRAGEVRTYVDGVLEETVFTSGVLDNWDETLPLVLGAAYNDTLHFNGRLDRIAIYDLAFDEEQATNVASGQPPGRGASAGRDPIVVWDELD